MSRNLFPINLKSFTNRERHDYILKTYVLNQEEKNNRQKRDIDIIRENHRFLWEDDEIDADNWEKRLARRYYDKLFKEYCVADLTCFKKNKIALRWRTESEVITGIGQFQCGSRKCEKTEGLRTWEVNFAYQEQNERKNALVKLRLCSLHSEQLNYNSKKREVKRSKEQEEDILKQKMLMRKQSKRRKYSNEKEKTESNEQEENEDESSEPRTSRAIQSITSEAERFPKADMEYKTRLICEEKSRENDFESSLQDLLL